MASISERNLNFYTSNGLSALEARIKSLIELFNKNEFPFGPNVIFGFGILKIDDREECFGRIKELADLIGFQLQLIKSETPNGVSFQITY